MRQNIYAVVLAAAFVLLALSLRSDAGVTPGTPDPTGGPTATRTVRPTRTPPPLRTPESVTPVTTPTAVPTPTPIVDRDGDGWWNVESGGLDCNDDDARVAADCADVDGDGHYNAAIGGDDCDDLDPTRWADCSPPPPTWIWPLGQLAYITSPYGPRGSGFHNGVDMVPTYADWNIYAIRDGCVLANDWYNGYGNRVVLSHPDGSASLYAHLEYPYVNVGECVEQGQAIGLMDSTGNSTGPHLHLEIRDGNGNRLDPLTVLPGLGGDGDAFNPVAHGHDFDLADDWGT